VSILAILALAVALSMDAFAVSVAEGAIVHKVTLRNTLRLALHFGAFQAAMPILGYFAGRGLRAWLAAWDHWIAFGLLAAIGCKMLADSILRFETHEPRGPSSGGRIIVLAVATSIDAAAAGVTLAMLEINVWYPALTIGLVTGCISCLGIQLGDRIGSRLGRWAEAVGGVTLCLIGVRILWSHLA